MPRWLLTAVKLKREIDTKDAKIASLHDTIAGLNTMLEAQISQLDIKDAKIANLRAMLVSTIRLRAMLQAVSADIGHRAMYISCKLGLICFLLICSFTRKTVALGLTIVYSFWSDNFTF